MRESTRHTEAPEPVQVQLFPTIIVLSYFTRVLRERQNAFACIFFFLPVFHR